MKAIIFALVYMLSGAASLEAMAESRNSSAQPIVIGQTHIIQSRILGQDREVNVYLPPEYADKSKRFPVLYIIDGGLDQDFLHVAGTSQLGAIWARSQPVVVVGVATKDRRAELAGPTSDPELLRKYPTAGKSSRFRDYIRNEVKPLIARTYRINGKDGVIGESLAGLFIAETYLREPTLFGAYAAISPSLWWDKERLSHEAAGLLGEKAPGRPLYLSVANEGADMQSGVDRLVAALGARTGWCYAPRFDLTHATIYHSISPAALQFLFPTDVEQDPESGFEIKCSKKS